MSEMTKLKESLTSYLDSQGWRYEVLRETDDSFIAGMGMSVRCRLTSIRLMVKADDNTIQSFGVCPIKANNDVIATVAEYITRANYGLKIGKFELDYSDGEVRYQSSLSCIGGQPDPKDVERVVDMPIIMYDTYGDGLVRSLMGLGNPEADIREAEEDE